jgi:hypothetical protein
MNASRTCRVLSNSTISPACRIQSLRQKPGLEPDPPHRKPKPRNHAIRTSGALATLGLTYNPPGHVDAA